MLEQVRFQLSHNWSSLTIRQFSTGINPANKLCLVITKLTKVQDSENKELQTTALDYDPVNSRQSNVGIARKRIAIQCFSGGQ